ncbi:hypothetical protein HYDPIDRAFT_177188 [Hydnomerulius pinastri MD-312]|uniref:UspA domain-containing protein n=1 Tax=Hydnomerulius pinastri MD-312 TaxID=994086 RepID=A0A0C9WBF1_9AGAM|nr:hypothetical protein HYDPIDRAFT_177188 [Hydnomerulius pinastri MD-312]
MVEPASAVDVQTRPRRRSWLQWYGHQKDYSRDLAKSILDAGLPSPQEEHPRPSSSHGAGSSTPRAEPSSRVDQSSSTHNGGSSHPSTSTLPSAAAAKPEMSARTTGSFGKMAFNSMIGGLTSLSLSRTNTVTSNINDDKDKEKEARGRNSSKRKPRSSSFVHPSTAKDKDRDTASVASKESARARSQSPFSLRRFRSRDRDQSPTPLPLEESDCESVTSRRSPAVRPRTAFTDDPDSGSEYAGEETEDEDDDWSDDTAGMFDFVTERNTEQNAQIATVGNGDGDAAMDPDPLGEGVNVVVPPEPYFPSTLNRSSFSSMRGKRGGPKRKKSKHHETLPLATSRPLFQRDRCTITVTQGDPDASGRRKRTYVVASDLSEESRYAVEWGIGTVLRDGDEMLIVTVVENENKVDPPIPNAADRATKLRSQQERQGLAYILVRQATSLLQRTRLHVTVSCQAWHAKNARHMLLDIVDYNEPTMLIVGSRGLGQLKGILLGSTSHYLIQRCSVPVMVARRRLKRPPKRSAHLAKHRVHVSLAEAGIDRVAAKVDQDVAVMRDEMQRDDERRGEKEAIDEEGEGEEPGEEGEGDGAEGEGYLGTKVRG